MRCGWWAAALKLNWGRDMRKKPTVADLRAKKGKGQLTMLRLFTPEELDALAAPSGLLGLPQEGAEEAGSEPP